jgi:hypothetical protein
MLNSLASPYISNDVPKCEPSDKKEQMANAAQSESTNTTPEGRRMILGLGLDSWNNLIVWFLLIGAGFGVLAGGATYAAFELQKQESRASKDEYERYKLTVAGKVADAKSEGIEAGKAAGGPFLRPQKQMSALSS